MLKRKAPKEFRCPGCQEPFDSEEHYPMIGTCGDSLCGVCVNEKKTKTCPVCNRRSFAWKQHNNLAIEMLAASTENEALASNKANQDIGDETYALGEPVPVILDPENRPFLFQIVNQLDPTSFLKLASTCKALQNYCFNCKDIKIIYNIQSIVVKMDDDGFKFGIVESSDFVLKVDEDGEYSGRLLPLDFAGYSHGFLTSAIGRKKFQAYPFEARLRDLVFHEVNRFDDVFFTPLRALFAEFSIKTVTGVATKHNSDWTYPPVSEGLMQLLKDFHIMRIGFGVARFAEDIREEFLNYLLRDTASFSADQMETPQRLLLNASVPMMHLRTSISSRTFVDLIKKFVDSTDEIQWALNCDFELRDALHFFKLLPFDYKDPLPAEHPIVFVKEDEPEEFRFLRKDGKLMNCCKHGHIYFTMCYPSEYPPCLRRGVDDSDVDD